MALRIHFPDIPAMLPLELPDDAGEVVIGRDPARCRVVFPPEETRVGREHCALKRVLGRYRLILNETDPVFVGDEPARDGQELPPVADLRLGPAGPRLLIETKLNHALADTRTFVRPRAHTTAIIALIDRRSRVNRGVAALTLALVVVGTGAATFAWRRSENANLIRDAEKDAIVGQLSEKLAALGKDVAGREQALGEVLARIAGSVVLVVRRDAAGRETPIATAFVVGADTLATNAHVAEGHATLAAGDTLWVRGGGEPPVEAAITAVTLHPGYDAFRKLWRERQPVREASNVVGVEPLAPIPACDVALMTVAGAGRFGPPLALAAPVTVEAMRAGQVVGFVGYPMEAMPVGGVNVRRPTPTTQVGHITAVTDFFLVKGLGPDGQLVQHSLPVAGGASGSPVVNSAGEVLAVVSAGSVVATSAGRVATGSGVNFAQRVDVLAELLDGTAEAVQSDRSARWRSAIGQFASLRERISGLLLTRWLGRSTPAGQADLVHDLAGRTTEEVSAGRHRDRRQLDLADAGDYLVMAVSDGDDDLDLWVFANEPLGQRLLGKDEEPDWYPVVALASLAAGPVDVTIYGPKPDAGYTLKIFRRRP